MTIFNQKLEKIEQSNKNYWCQRIFTQLKYALKLAESFDKNYDKLLKLVQDFLIAEFQENGVIGKKAAIKAEEMMMELSNDAKKYKIICAAHAHIDMNWMWSWDETVSITINTFRTILKLMEEYPNFTFSQSQASVYEIIEKYNPDMLEEIKRRVKEGRWEVTASTWVEADKNMPNGESMARHLLYTKNYLSKLLEIDPTSLNIDFEPDTFGHSHNVPEILAQGGVKYYYHCRGYQGHNLYRWQSPAGSSVLVYREPIWYNASIQPEMVLYLPEFCQKHNLDTMLKVYGVGDHGGGPTRRDLNRIEDMKQWPVFPQIEFGTFADFYKLAEDKKDNLPVVDKELNFVFTGCYTSQSRIKMANRIGENTLNEAETLDTLAALSFNSNYPLQEYTSAWKNVLFNQFHDIIPGSGTIETREYAMGLFQETMAIANNRRKLSLETIASNIDTSDLLTESQDGDSTAEGAGVGFGVDKFQISQTSRGNGKERIFHIYNPASFQREETVEITIWDWQGDTDRLLVKDAEGNKILHQLIDEGFNNYWGHDYLRLLIKSSVPACGYNTYLISEIDDYVNTPYPTDPRVEEIDEFVLENIFLRVEIDTTTGVLKSILDKETGREFVDQDRNGGLYRFINEDDQKGMTSWIVGRYMKIDQLTSNVKIKQISNGPVRQSVEIGIEFGDSRLKSIISLDRNSKAVNFEVECEWFERGRKGEDIPQLNYYIPLAYNCSAYMYDIPYGTITREGMDRDVPANSWALGVPEQENSSAMMLTTNNKYGFRSVDNSLGVTLIRGSYDPDPYPEIGEHKLSFSLAVVEPSSNREYIEKAYAYNHPFSVMSAESSSGKLATKGSFIELEEGTVILAAVKMAEGSEDKLILRFYETDGDNSNAVLNLFKEPVKAYFVDINEKLIDGEAIKIDGRKISFRAIAYQVISICLEF